MMARIKLFKPSPQKSTASIIKDVHAEHKPSLLKGSYTGERWRHKSMEKTLDWITDLKKSEKLAQQAQINLNLWAKKKSPSPKLVEVIPKDWGLATLEATKKYGVSYSVLNMANPQFPGGAALEGGSAQEENIWHRSTCAQSLLDPSIYLDQKAQAFCYHEAAKKLLEAKIKMTQEEYEALKKHSGETDTQGYKVFFSPESRICFRGPEIVFPKDPEDFTSARYTADSGLSYAFLPESDIFPFYELRSAAPQLPFTPHALDLETRNQYIADLRRRIAAQLDTLILAKQPNAILGAWGCGEFKNDPQIVAKIYGEEIEKRAHFFDHIVFPIINTGSYNNYAIFNQHLTDIKLGAKPAVISNLTLE
ncbi:poly(ADP-ribose) glycohydrolase domain-containing protein [Legionella sp. WA2024007413]